MSNPKKLAKALLFAGLIGAGVVIACGPDFPAQLLDDRGGTLHATPSNSFRYEAARLTPATDALRAAIPIRTISRRRHTYRKTTIQNWTRLSATPSARCARRQTATRPTPPALASRKPRACMPPARWTTCWHSANRASSANSGWRGRSDASRPSWRCRPRSLSHAACGRRTCWLISGTSPAPSTTMPPRGHKPPRPTNTPANWPAPVRRIRWAWPSPATASRRACC